MGAEEDDAASRRRVPRWARALGAVVLVLVALVVGGRLDDAPTAGRYRPALPPSPFGTICDPLPDGVVLDLPVQLRRDRWLATKRGTVRRLTLHYDLHDEEDAEHQVRLALRAARFSPVAPAEGADPAIEQWFDRPDYGRVGVTVAPFDVDPSSVVRGRISIDLPPGSLDETTASACTDYVQTKRFPPGLDTYEN
jgi:hypothetical protein